MGERSALVVDDDPDVRALLRLVLELSTGFVCFEAVDGAHALEMWRAHRHDLVVLDHAMPGLSGLDVARAILELEPEQIVIIFSAVLDPRVIESAKQIGVRTVLTKDEFKALTEAVRDVDSLKSG